MNFTNTALHLKKSRNKSGLTQVFVSKKLALESHQFISNWERGISAPPARSWPMIAKIYGIKFKTIEMAYLKDVKKYINQEKLRVSQKKIKAL